MYESYFDLREPAFSITPDSRFVWLSPTAEEGLAALYYGIQHRKGFILLTGDIGAGKTTLLRAVLRCLPKESLDVPGTAGTYTYQLQGSVAKSGGSGTQGANVRAMDGTFVATILKR